MSITLYGTTELILVQQLLPDLPDGFWRNLYPRVITSDRQEIMFERADVDNRKLAPFVAPNVQGRVMRGQGYYAESFKPAYVKPKHVIEPHQAIPRMMGEPLLGGMTLQARFNAHVANSLRLQREMIERRWDWMAARATIDGMVTVSGDDYPTKLIDFKRDASLTITLAGTARWDQTATANPLGDLADASDDAFNLGHAPITDIVFGMSAWKEFIKNSDVLDLLNTQKRGSTSDFARTVLTQSSNYQAMGFIDGPGGRFNMWRYRNWYSDVDSDGDLIQLEYLDPRDVVGYGPALQGTAMFGAIMDASANFLTEATIYPKQWAEQDPSVIYTMSQSAPLFAPLNPNNSFKIRVMS